MGRKPKQEKKAAVAPAKKKAETGRAEHVQRFIIGQIKNGKTAEDAEALAQFIFCQ